MKLLSSLFLIVIIFSTQVSSIKLDIHGNTLKTLNGVSKTSPDLLSLDAYYTQPLVGNNSIAPDLRPKYGVNSLGLGAFVNFTIFFGADENCCDTPSTLTKYIESGQACANYKKSYLIQTFSNTKFKETGIELYMMLLARCTSDVNNPIVNKHCSKLVPIWQACQGVPNNNDGWWSILFTGLVKCTLETFPGVTKFHLWNEPDWTVCGNSGENYGTFYQQVATAVKKQFPKIQLGGPVSWTTPSRETSWETWWLPFINLTAPKQGSPTTLDLFDYHAYTTSNGDNDGLWDKIMTDVHVLNLYYRWANGRSLMSHITETNFNFGTSTLPDNSTQWNKRVISNMEQIIGMSHMSDKFGTRLEYGINAPGYGWMNSVSMDAYSMLKDMQGKEMIQFEVVGNSNNTVPFCDVNAKVSSQLVYDSSTNNAKVFLINNNGAAATAYLNDVDKAISWNSNGEAMTVSGQRVIKQTIPVSTSSRSSGSVGLAPYSITVVGGKYSTKPSKIVSYQEYIPAENCFMQGFAKVAPLKYTCTISFSNPSGKPAVSVILKVGVLRGGLGSVWVVSGSIGGTTINLWNAKPPARYNEFKLGNTAAFDQKGMLVVNITGVFLPVPGRLAYTSLLIGR